MRVLERDDLRTKALASVSESQKYICEYLREMTCERRHLLASVRVKGTFASTRERDDLRTKALASVSESQKYICEYLREMTCKRRHLLASVKVRGAFW